jgi:dTDP-4-amino-4,6-dideoxygalactose transaminase
MDIPFFNTYIHYTAPQRVVEVLKSTFLSEGKLVAEFEAQLALQLGWIHPITVNSGTSALHLALNLAGIAPGDEVILPAQTFVATGLAVLYCGATPVFADIHYETGNIDPIDVRRRITNRTKAIMAVDWGGMPCDMDALRSIAEEHNLLLIEDAAHAPGALYRNKPIGSIADFTCFSFQAIKHITTGDGGAVCIQNPELLRVGLARRWFGIDRAHAQPSILGERAYDINTPGFKYHLSDYGAALGLANIENFPQRLARRRTLVARYRTALATLNGIRLFDAPSDRESAWWLLGIHVAERREDLIRALKSKGIASSVVHVGIDRNSVFGGIQTHLTAQRRFDATQLHLPIHDAMDEQKIDRVIDAIRAGW